MLALTATALFGLTTTANAQLMSPKLAENQPRVAPAGSQQNDPDLLHPYTGKFVYSPKTTDLRETMTVGTLEKDPDLIRRDRALANVPPKLRNNRPVQIEIAPVK